jgi:hypothetical protein
MSNTLEDLRTHLFETLTALRAKDAPMDIDRAKAISEVAKTVIDSARVEVDYVKATGQDQLALPVFGVPTAMPQQPGVRTHRLR